MTSHSVLLLHLVFCCVTNALDPVDKRYLLLIFMLIVPLASYLLQALLHTSISRAVSRRWLKICLPSTSHCGGDV
ncbi:hypothetical protein BJ875DRAFT_271455 [Amylocarpus encephaloides]|uniref:Uncharacterized protein n=1 Tax=Amylocarpus encephaloides TaxID=45428 RepID=A0A9P7YKX3_9HELO|nr:hypothetical protein BJ875DRAFT_271455 [Amylocarpus encephaloides]